jgi:acetyl esterase/lipase
MTRPVSLSLSRRRLVHGSALAGAAALLPAWGWPALAQGTPETEDTFAEGVRRTRDVVYGEVDGTTLMIDVLHPPTREAPRPAVLVLHGGGLIGGDRTGGVEHATYLAEAGYVAFTIDYRLFQQRGGTNINPWPAQLDDAQRAVRWVRANAATYGVDPKRVGAYGHSSGGYLAAMLGVRETRDTSDSKLAEYSSRVTCVVDLAGDSDLTIPLPAAAAHFEEIMVGMLGGTLEEVPEAHRDASPITHVDEESVPFLIIHGAKDFDVPVENSRRLEDALHEAGVEVAYVELPNADHMIPAWWLMTGPWVLTFLGLQLHPER